VTELFLNHRQTTERDSLSLCDITNHFGQLNKKSQSMPERIFGQAKRREIISNITEFIQQQNVKRKLHTF
jgi:hypothetical protein